MTYRQRSVRADHRLRAAAALNALPVEPVEPEEVAYIALVMALDRATAKVEEPPHWPIWAFIA